MVIIEVDRSFERFDSLLGMHIWSSFLKNPTDEEKDKASKVFWCHYNSGRLVEKNGEPFPSSLIVLIWEHHHRVEAHQRRGTLVPRLESPQHVSSNWHTTPILSVLTRMSLYSTIKHPYPKTTYCDVPAEAQTGVPLCRPLPKSTFPPPASRPRPTGMIMSPSSQGVSV